MVRTTGTRARSASASQPPMPTTTCAYLSPNASVSPDASHTLYAASMDPAGNTEAVRSARFKIDATPPTVTCETPPTFVYGQQSGATVQATVYDLTSGPQGGTPGSTTTISVVASTATVGTSSVPLTGFDNAGNSSQRNCSYKVNKAATTTTVKSSANPSVIGQNAQLTATLSGPWPGAGPPGGKGTFNA